MGVGVSRYFGTPWFPRESNSILKIFSLACRPLTQENQLMIMLKYPFRFNLDCLIIVLWCTGRGLWILEPILDCRHPKDRENHYHSGQQWTRTTPVRTCFTDRLPYPNDFYYPIFVPRDGIEPPPFVCKTNTLPLRHRGNLYREMVMLHSKVRYEPSLVLDLSVVLVDIDSSSILGFPPNPSLPLRESNSPRVDQNHVY